MRTRLARVAALFAMAATIGAVSTVTAKPADEDIEVRSCYMNDVERTCICMFNKVTKESRRICPEDGGCWHDYGWIPWNGGNVLPSSGGDALPVYYDNNHNMYIMVGPTQGGVFSGSAIGTCLAFTSNNTSAIMLPAHLVQ